MTAMFLRDEGHGEVVLLLPGLGASHRIYDGVFERLTPQRRLLAIDLPRSGRSGAFASHRPAHIAEALEEALRQREIRRLTLMGHSFGGLVAMELAERIPHLIARLVIASSPGVGVPTLARQLLQGTPASWVGKLGSLSLPRAAVRAYLKLIWGQARPFDEGAAEHAWQAAQVPGFAEGMWESLQAVAAFRIPPSLKGSPPPGSFARHVLWGDRDLVVPIVQGEQLASAIGARLEVLHGVGHCLPEEAPEAVSRAILGPPREG